MYNLLVSADENDWNGGPIDLERSRCVAEYTDPEIAARFGDLKTEQVRELCALPCVFAYEKPCAKDPKFGVLRAVRRLASGDARIEYSILPCEPFATAGDLESLGRELDITRFELNRRHWAVKDVDLALELGRRGIALPGWASGRRQDVDIERHRFRVALSFPGEHRAYVERVAAELDHLLGPDACFYDRFYEAQLARPNLDGLLHRIYGEGSDLVVAFVCAEYDEKLWCGIEWRKIRERGATGDDRELMYVKLGEGEVTGMTRLDGYVDGRERGPEEVARMIADRARLGKAAVRGRTDGDPASRGTRVASPGDAPAFSRAAPGSGDLAIGGAVTDAMRQRYLMGAFDYIATYVERSGNALEAEHAGRVEYIATRVDATSFEATLFVGGRRRSHCGVWMSTGGAPGLGAGIYYSNEGVGSRNGYNEVLTVGDDPRGMYLEATIGDWSGRVEGRLSEEAAAEYLWQKLKQPLA